ncbi:hypothetical protein [Massilia sp. CCM 8734]|uniref:hypothetical protein n=1 Tax=Massilia sp. CCM 8734 TaxID=2609283 RepID=UPI001423D515|nr:hypothetical protein [Massilia sp. CCM 8734]
MLSASASTAQGKITVDWSTAQVNFSSGTGGNGTQPMMVYLVFNDSNQEIICNMDQVFLLADGKYTTAPQNVGERQLSAGKFKTYRISAAGVPYGASAMFTPGQAADILEYGSMAPLSNPIPIPQALFSSIKAQMSGFYPDIDFYYDPLELTPNLYAFEAYGRKVVQMNGGLARMSGFNYEGLFMAMAHGVACHDAGAPKDRFGLATVGQADWYAFSTTSRLMWISDPFMTYIMTAMNQWSALFALVTPANAAGNPLDPLNDPSLDCRLQTIRAAAAGGALPECAGGALRRKIALEQANAISPTHVTVNFSLAVDQATGANPTNYTFCP